jgi:flagellar basal-body rod protein FlgB
LKNFHRKALFLEYILLAIKHIEGEKMGLEISKAHSLMAKALDHRAARQDLIAGNIANEDTPFYRPRDIRFEEALTAESKKIFNEPKVPRLQLAQTNGAHFSSALDEGHDQAKLFYRDGHLARNDGNSVDLDVETTEMTKNSMMFQGITAALKKEAAIFKAVLQASERTQ